MHRHHRIIHILVVTAALGVLFPADAFAYLDPGAGSLFIQSVVAAVAAVGYALRLYWGRITALVKRSSDPARRAEMDSGRR